MIVLILVLATLLRFIRLDQSLWLDEAINVTLSQKYNLWEFITKYPVSDFHPPLYFGILWIWTRFFGTSEIASRIPSVIFSIAAIYLTYLLAKKLFNLKIGLLASLFLSLSPLHVYYSQEARMYSLATFGTVLSFYALVSFLKQQSRVFLVLYILSLILIYYTDYLVYLVIPTQFLYIIFFERKFIFQILISQIISLIALSPWMVGVFPKQLTVGTYAAQALPGWKQVVGGSNIKDLGLVFVKTVFGRVTLQNKALYGIFAILAAIFYGFISVVNIKKIDKNFALILFWLFIPLAATFFISFFIPVFAYFRMIFILPAFYILVSRGLEFFPKRVFVILLGTIIITNLLALLIYYGYPEFQREDWKGAVKFVTNENGSLIILENDNIFLPFTYYYPQATNVLSGLRKVPAGNEQDVVDLDVNPIKIYLVEYLADITDPQRLLQKKLEHSGYKKTNIYNFSGVGFIDEYSKN